MNTQQSFCRLYGLLAHDAPRAVILRRGPTRWVQLILWHTDSDTFEEGQWFRGRIYEGVSDLSPDGTRFIYMARKAETQERRQSEFTHKWTAISKPPYFTALAAWAHGDDWSGGGVFIDNKTVWLNSRSSRSVKRPPQGLKVIVSQNAERFHQRDRRDGWQIQTGQFSFEKQAGFTAPGIKGITARPYIWQKEHPGGRYQLVIEIYREPNFQRALLRYIVDKSSGQQTLLEELTWVDWDQRGRLVFARDGKLFASDNAEVPLQTSAIADFNNNTPEIVLPPHQAKRW